jgi:hypothetical protein
MNNRNSVDARDLDPALARAFLRALDRELARWLEARGFTRRSRDKDCLKATDPKSSPPELAQAALNWIAGGDSEAILGDLHEIHERRSIGKVSSLEHFLSKLHYWGQVLRSVPGFLEIRIRHALARAARRPRSAR